jgi:transcription-repair coupling factor (superfamily II helicase)
MKERKKKFINIIKIEMEDLIEDLNNLVDDYKEKKEKDLITNYVFMENLALIQHEMYGIGKFSEIVCALNLEDYKDIEEISDHIKDILEKKIATSDFANCLFPMISRRIAKASKYVKDYL